MHDLRPRANSQCGHLHFPLDILGKVRPFYPCSFRFSRIIKTQVQGFAPRIVSPSRWFISGAVVACLACFFSCFAIRRVFDPRVWISVKDARILGHC
jgi:hypothetical protein